MKVVPTTFSARLKRFKRSGMSSSTPSRVRAGTILSACVAGCGVALAFAVLAFYLNSVARSTLAPDRISAQIVVGPDVTQSAIAAPHLRRSERRAAARDQAALASVERVSKSARKALQNARDPILISRAGMSEDAGATESLSQSVDEPILDSHGNGVGDLDELASDRVWTSQRSDTFRTVCVRLCDGAYFPVSFSTTRARFKADAARCESSCGSPSRLFIVKPDGAPDDMVDLRGAAYGDLPNAFRFRTTYDAACTCRAHPWEEAAKDRHREFAKANPAPPNTPTPPAALSARRVAPDIALAERLETGGSVASVAIRGLFDGQRLAADRSGRAGQGPTVPAVSGILSADVALPVRKPEKLAARAAKKQLAAKASAAALAENGRRAGKILVASTTDKASQMQRPFKSSAYWRLSYWDQTP